MKKTKIYLNYPKLIGIMDVSTIAFDELKPLKNSIILKLGEIEAVLNYLKQKDFKTNVEAQERIVKINYDKKHYKKMIDEIDKRLEIGW